MATHVSSAGAYAVAAGDGDVIVSSVGAYLRAEPLHGNLTVSGVGAYLRIEAGGNLTVSSIGAYLRALEVMIEPNFRVHLII